MGTSMGLKLVDFDNFCKKLPEVTSPKIEKTKGKHDPFSLFSEQIFGPEKPYTCQCGIQKKGGTCEICGVDYVDSTVRRERWAKLNFNTKMIHPFLFKIIKDKYSKILSEAYHRNAMIFNKKENYFCELYEPYDNLVNNNFILAENELPESFIKRVDESVQYYITKDKDRNSSLSYFAKYKVLGPDMNPVNWAECKKRDDESNDDYIKRMEIFQDLLNNRLKETYKIINANINDYELDEDGDLKIYYGVEYLYSLLYFVIDNKKPKDEIKSDHIMLEYKNMFFIHSFPILPAGLRPVGLSSELTVKDPINDKYIHLINKINSIENIRISHTNNNIIMRDTWKILQVSLDELFEHVKDSLSGHEGLIRKNILGKRIDFSGRTVITVDPTIPPNIVKFPYIMALELYKLNIVRRLKDHEMNTHTLLDILKYVNHVLDIKSNDLYDLVKNQCDNEIIMINRQPSLHRGSIEAFEIEIYDGLTMCLNPVICLPFNADFDGDQMAIYLPLSKEAKSELYEKLYIPNNLINGNLQVQHIPEQDIVLGIYQLTKDIENEEYPGYSNIYEKIDVNGISTTLGRKIFNEVLALPEFINEPISSKKLIKCLNISYNNDKNSYMGRLDMIKKIGLEINDAYPVTISLEGLLKSNVSHDKKYSIYHDIPDEILKENNREKIQEIKLENYRRETEFLNNELKSDYLIFLKSGSRGSMDQMKQLLFAKGYLATTSGEIMDTPIKNSTIDGLSMPDYYQSCYGARKGIADAANKVQTTGHLTRRLVYVLAGAVANEDVDDCGSEKLLKFIVTDKNYSTIIKRYYKLTPESPDLLYTGNDCSNLIGKTIYLRSPMFCKCEHGLCRKCTGDFYKDLKSKEIGIITAQMIGERGTQLILKSFHLSGAEKVDKDKNKDVVSGLDGLISSLLASNPKSPYYKNPLQLLEILQNLYSKFNILDVYYEIIISQLYYYKQNYKNIQWRKDPDQAWIKMNLDNIPTIRSWLEGLQFQANFNTLLEGFDGGEQTSILGNILLNKF